MKKTLESKVSLELLTEVIRSIDEFGVDGTLTILKESRDMNEGTMELKNFIFSYVCRYYSLTKSKITSQKKSNSEQLYNAKCVISYLIYKNCDLNQHQIGKEMRRSYSIVSRYINYIQSLSTNIPSEKKLKQDLVIIEGDVNRYKLNKLKNGS